MISAILFDFDGVIVDSERLHWTAFNTVLRDPVSWEEYVETLIGFDDRDAFGYLFPTLGKSKLEELIAKKAVAFQTLLESDGAAALPGAVELIRSLSGNIPIAICSGALLEDILPILGTLGIENAFDTIVTADDTHVSKPDPAPYSKAWKNLTERFQTLETISSGIAIEDTPAGIASAKGAGLKVLAVTNSYEAEFLSEADVVIDSLEGLTLETLNELI